jgi:hypothetical protein
MTYGDLIELLEPHKDKELKFTGCAMDDWTTVDFYDGSETLLVIKRTMGTTNIEVRNYGKRDY